MVSFQSFVGMGFTLMIVVFMPVSLALILYRRQVYSLLSILVGVLVFVVSQIIIRMPFLNVLSRTSWHQQRSSSMIFLLVVYALSAGLFEESGRWIGFRFFRKNHLNWKNAVAFGIGHGGIEGLIIVGNTYLNNLIFSAMINVGGYEAFIAPALGDQAQPVRDALINTPSYQFFLAGIERMAVLPVHIALSILVCLAVLKKRFLYLLLAIVLHGLVNVPAVLMMSLNIGLLVVELIIVGLGILAIWAIFRMKNKFPV